MDFEQPLFSEFRLPADEIVKTHYQVPDWWDKEVTWRTGQPKPPGNRNGRPPKTELSVKERVSQALRAKPWQTVKELCEIVDSQRKSISEAAASGWRDGIFVRRIRSKNEYEYKIIE